MADLRMYLHGRLIESIFELLGSKENDITYSLGWALAHSPWLTAAVLRHALSVDDEPSVEEIRLQERAEEPGITDIEIVGPAVHAIIEAKRGWQLPTRRQLTLYAPRLRRLNRQRQVLVTMSEATPEFASLHPPKDIDGVPVVHLAWKDIIRLSRVRQGTHAEKRLLAQLRGYLARIVSMQNQQSNLVYVVSLGSGAPEWSQLSWIDFVEKERCYFHPVGRGGWPKEPPNYIGVRYRGHLQSIHHVNSWELVDSLDGLSGVRPGRNAEGPLFLYRLGPPILPPKPTPAGDRIKRSARVWAMLDLLLTCDTVTDAMLETKRRLQETD